MYEKYIKATSYGTILYVLKYKPKEIRTMPSNKAYINYKNTIINQRNKEKKY